MDYTSSKFLNNKNDNGNRSIKYLLLLIMVLVTLIYSRKNPEFNNYFKSNINISKIHNIIEKYFGSSIPLESLNKDVLVSDVSISYNSKKDYKNGVELGVDSNYVVPALDSGIVLFNGKKDDLGNVLIIQQSNGINVWYFDINSDLKLYSYIEKGSILGEVNNKLYLYFEKDGKFLDYKEFI